ncbi:TPA: hypothetical protein R7G56_000560 [Klebsiella pneumoniae]|nr:hypothetical protein [Klebsiella pneumoniae]
MWDTFIVNIVTAILLLGFALVGWFFTDYRLLNHLYLPRKFRKINHALVIYSRFLNSGGSFRRILFLLVVLSLSFVIFTDSSKYKFFENMAFSTIAAFIFDMFLNFQKEHLAKCMVSRYWHSAYYSCYDREKVLLALFLNGKSLPKKIEISSLYKLIFICLFETNKPATLEAISLPWSSDGTGMKVINLPKGYVFNELILEFIREDAKFINGFYLDEKVTLSFPGMNDISRRFNNSCLVALSMVETKLGLQNGWNGNDDMIMKQLHQYLEDRHRFMTECETQFGHYGTTGI